MRVMIGRSRKSLAVESLALEEQPRHIVYWGQSITVHQLEDALFPLTSLLHIASEVSAEDWMSSIAEDARGTNKKLFIYCNVPMNTDEKLPGVLQLNQLERLEKTYELDILVTVQTDDDEVSVMSCDEFLQLHV